MWVYTRTKNTRVSVLILDVPVFLPCHADLSSNQSLLSVRHLPVLLRHSQLPHLESGFLFLKKNKQKKHLKLLKMWQIFRPYHMYQKVTKKAIDRQQTGEKMLQLSHCFISFPLKCTIVKNNNIRKNIMWSSVLVSYLTTQKNNKQFKDKTRSWCSVFVAG